MNGEYTRILLQIKGVLQGIDQSLYNLAENFDRLTKQIIKENEENDK
jgi:hypothetical protein